MTKFAKYTITGAYDISSWDATSFKNSGLVWNGSTWLPMPSGGTGGSLTQAQADTLYHPSAQNMYHTYDYIVYREGGTFYARNGSTGAIESTNANAATVIQYAIDNVEYGGNVGGGVVYLKSGLYSLNTPLRIKDDCVSLIGENSGHWGDDSVTEFQPGADMLAMIMITGGLGASTVIKKDVIKGIKFRNPGHAYKSEAIFLRNTAHPVIEDCGFNRISGTAIHFSGANYAPKVHKCDFQYCGMTTSGTILYDGGGTYICTSPFVWDCVFEPSRYVDIHSRHASRINLINNYFECDNDEPRLAHIYGVLIYGIVRDNVFVTENSFSATPYAIYAQGTSYSVSISDNNIENFPTGVRCDSWGSINQNYISKASGAGIWLNGHDCLVSDNFLYRCGGGTSGKGGIYANNADNSLIDSNKFRECHKYAINLNNTSDSLIANNMIFDEGTGNLTAAITEGSSDGGNHFLGNHMSDAPVAIDGKSATSFANLNYDTNGDITINTSSYISTQTGVYAHFISANASNIATTGDYHPSASNIYSTADYIIYKENNAYYARDGSEGNIVYSSTHKSGAAGVIQSCIDDVVASSKGSIFIRGNNSTFFVTSQITISQNSIGPMIHGDMPQLWARKDSAGNFTGDSMIAISGTTSGPSDCHIENIELVAGDIVPYGIKIDDIQTGGHFRNIEVNNYTAAGIKITALGSNDSNECTFERIRLDGNQNAGTYGLLLEQTAGVAGRPADLVFRDVVVIDCRDVGFYLKDATKITLQDCLCVNSSQPINACFKLHSTDSGSASINGVRFINCYGEMDTAPFGKGIHILASGTQIQNTLIDGFGFDSTIECMQVQLEHFNDADVNQIKGTVIKNPRVQLWSSNSIKVGSYVENTTIHADGFNRTRWEEVISDSGEYTLINGVGQEAAGAGNSPNNSYPLGAIVENTDDNSIWLRQIDTTWALLSGSSTTGGSGQNYGYDYIIYQDGADFKAQNGVTGEVDSTSSDATTVIQYANDQLTDGGKIYIAPGDYSVDQIVLGTSVHLEGAHRRESADTNTRLKYIQIGNLDRPMISSSANEVAVRNLYLYGKWAQGSGAGGTHAIYLDGNFCEVSDCFISNWYGDAININGQSTHVLRNRGNNIQRNFVRITASDCYVNENTATASGAIFYINAADCKLVNNDAYLSDTSYGIWIDTSGDHGTCNSNRVNDNFNTGIYCAGTSVTLVGNRSRLGSNYGMSIVAGRCTVVGNIIEENDEAGLYISSRDNVITNNIFKDNGQDASADRLDSGIYISNTGDNIFSNNQCFGTDQNHGIYEYNCAGEKNIIMGNILSGNNTDGYNSNQTSDSVFRSNIGYEEGDFYSFISSQTLHSVIISCQTYKGPSTGGGGMSNVVEDTTPQLGGDLGGQKTYGITGLTTLTVREDPAEIYLINETTNLVDAASLYLLEGGKEWGAEFTFGSRLTYDGKTNHFKIMMDDENDASGAALWVRRDDPHYVTVGRGSLNTAGILCVSGGNYDNLLYLKSNEDRAFINILDNDTSGFIGVQNGYLYLGANASLNSDNLVIGLTSPYNIGIGDTSPDYTFEVGGSIWGNQISSNNYRVFSNGKVTFRDEDLYIQSSADGDLKLRADDDLFLHSDAQTPQIWMRSGTRNVAIFSMHGGNKYSEWYGSNPSGLVLHGIYGQIYPLINLDAYSNDGHISLKSSPGSWVDIRDEEDLIARFSKTHHQFYTNDNEILMISGTGDDTYIFGGDASATNDLYLLANSVDENNDRTEIRLYGGHETIHGGVIENRVGQDGEFRVNVGNSNIFHISTNTGSVCHIYGPDGDDEDLYIHANRSDKYAQIKLNGAGFLNLYHNDDKGVVFFKEPVASPTEYFRISSSADGVGFISDAFDFKSNINTPSISSSTISGSHTTPIIRGGGKPTAAASYEGQIYRTSGSGSDKTYVWMCVRNSAGSYEWIQIGVST